MSRGNQNIGHLTVEQRAAAVAKSKISRAKNKNLQASGRFFEPGTKVSLMKRIRCKCLDCSGYSKLEIKLCTVVNCPLFEVRLGRKTMRADATEKDAKELEDIDVEIDEEEDDLEGDLNIGEEEFDEEIENLDKEEESNKGTENKEDSGKDEISEDKKDSDDLEDIEL